MIGFISGRILECGDLSVIVNVHDIGYRLNTASRVGAVGEEVSLWVHTLLKKDETILLFGFKTKEELSLFETFLSVSGVGPKTALSLVSLGDVSDVAAAVAQGDASYLNEANGVSKKLAEKIVIDLNNKFIGDDTTPSEWRDVYEALITLGYQKREAREAARASAKAYTSTAEQLRHSISLLKK